MQWCCQAIQMRVLIKVKWSNSSFPQRLLAIHLRKLSRLKCLTSVWSLTVRSSFNSVNDSKNPSNENLCFWNNSCFLVTGRRCLSQSVLHSRRQGAPLDYSSAIAGPYLSPIYINHKATIYILLYANAFIRNQHPLANSCVCRVQSKKTVEQLALRLFNNELRKNWAMKIHLQMIKQSYKSVQLHMFL